MSIVLTRLTRFVGGAWFGATLLLSSIQANAEADFHLDSIGVRYGVGANSSSSRFFETRVFAQLATPWTLDLGRDWNIKSRVDFSAGWLGERDGDNSAIFGAGPQFVLGHEKIPLSFVIGIEGTGLSHHEFESKDFGFPFQFTSHAGLQLDLGGKVRIAYRYQHMSNAHLSHHNPGLNEYMVCLSYLF